MTEPRDALREAAQDVYDRGPIESDGETLDEWCRYCDTFDLAKHREGCAWVVLGAALAASPTPDALDVEVLRRAVSKHPHGGSGDWPCTAECADEIGVEYAAIIAARGQQTRPTPEWDDDDDGDHSAFTHRDDDEPPPYARGQSHD